jgi:colanic acid biosynthesis glycosyl transferase WcaI
LEEVLIAASKPRVLLITQWFDPEPTFKGLVFARELVSQGFEVEVITGFPNYPGGKVYAGYKIKLIERQIIDEVNVTRLPLYPNHSQSAIKRVLNYVSFAISVLVYGLFIAKRSDVIYAYHPPLTVGVVACIIRRVRGIPLVYDIQDMWPDTLRATGMLRNLRALALVGYVCNWVYRCVDQIVVLSPGFKKLLVQRGVSDSKIELIYNWSDESALSVPIGTLPLNFPKLDQFKIVFAGNIGKAQALNVVLDAAVILKNRQSRVAFVLMGGGVEVKKLTAKTKHLGLDNVVFLPSVPMSEVGTVLSGADVLLVHLRNDPLFEITIPSKTQAYMAVGRPLLMAVKGDAADLVVQSKAGIIIEPENPLALATAAQELANLPTEALQLMGKNALLFYEEKLSLRVGVSKFATIFRKLVCKTNICK